MTGLWKTLRLHRARECICFNSPFIRAHAGQARLTRSGHHIRSTSSSVQGSFRKCSRHMWREHPAHPHNTRHLPGPTRNSSLHSAQPPAWSRLALSECPGRGIHINTHCRDAQDFPRRCSCPWSLPDARARTLPALDLDAFTTRPWDCKNRARTLPCPLGRP